MSLGQSSATDSVLIFRSNVTPEITINLENLFTPNSNPPPETVQGSNKLALQLIKPEIIVNSYGIEKPIAPYGIPETGMYVYFFGGLLAAMLTGAIITFIICRNF